MRRVDGRLKDVVRDGTLVVDAGAFLTFFHAVMIVIVGIFVAILRFGEDIPTTSRYLMAGGAAFVFVAPLFVTWRDGYVQIVADDRGWYWQSVRRRELWFVPWSACSGIGTEWSRNRWGEGSDVIWMDVRTALPLASLPPGLPRRRVGDRIRFTIEAPPDQGEVLDRLRALRQASTGTPETSGG